MSPDVRLASAPDPFVRGADERRVVEGLGQRVLEPPLFPASGGGILRHQLQKGSAPVHQEGRLRGAIKKTLSRTVALILVITSNYTTKGCPDCLRCHVFHTVFQTLFRK